MSTLKKIATEAGVSIMTVSNVINGNHSKVSAKTIQKVNDIIRKYNYTPNLNARSLSKKSSKLIAVFFNTYGDEQNYFEDPYLSRLFGELESFIRQAGYFTIIRSMKENENPSFILQSWNVDGAIFLNQQPPDIVVDLTSSAKCPLVFIDTYPIDGLNSLNVCINDFKGGYIATKHLIEEGHKNIAFVGYLKEENKVVCERYNGYERALLEANIEPYEPINIFTRYEDGLYVGKNFANEVYNVSAIFATADILALGIIEGARLNGITVPNDLSIVGFDDLSLCTQIRPNLTTISQNIKDKAKAAVDLLMKAISSPEKYKSFNVTVDVELRIRQTVQRYLNR